jgi:hypothetical protein
MNEPQELVLVYLDCLSLNISVMELIKGKMYCSSWIISSVLHKQVLRVSALLGRMPSAVGYQPTLATEMGAMQAYHFYKQRVYYICTSGLRTCG